MTIMVIVAHPHLYESRANQAFVQELQKHPELTVRDLYREYPNWLIDVEKEQLLLKQHDRIVFQFPFYWYSCPPLLKKWLDDVFLFGWAYGPGGDHLLGKEFMLATTTGGSEEGYRSGGYNWFTISELLRPLQSTIIRCKGTFLPAFVAYGAAKHSDHSLSLEARRFVDYIQSSSDLLQSKPFQSQPR